jgi:hypothetical protein
MIRGAFGHKKQLLNLFWLRQDRLLSLIDSKFLQHDRGGIGFGSNFGQA